MAAGASTWPSLVTFVPLLTTTTMRLLLFVAATLAATAAQRQALTQQEYQRQLDEYNRALAAQPGYNQQTQPVISRNEVRDEANQFSLQYDTADGQHFQETGALKPTADGSDHVLVKMGSYSYYPPGSQTPVQVTYTADEGGFHPQGNVLPQAPTAQTF